ncbi:TlpA family protein disulfide reductase [candidate division KSB1 bacterium]|nr:TlpA family protein disulfide reductase [candidate division KSB1 bacterium]
MNRMKLSILVILVLCTIGVRADTALNFKLPDLRTRQVQLTDLLKQGPVVLDFWATWCKPCAKVFPKLNALYEKYNKQGLTVVGINEDGPRSQAKVKPFVRSLKITFPILIDSNNDVMRRLQVQSLPTTILIGSDGTVLARHIGYHPDEFEMLENEIQAILKDTE